MKSRCESFWRRLGTKSGKERDRELIMLLKQNTLDAISILKHGIRLGLDKMEELAVNLEAIHQREQRQASEGRAIMTEQEVEFHAVGEKSGFSRGPKQGRGSGPSAHPGQDCVHCGRVRGHEAG